MISRPPRVIGQTFKNGYSTEDCNVVMKYVNGDKLGFSTTLGYLRLGAEQPNKT